MTDYKVNQQKPSTQSDYLYDLDQITQEVLNIILDYQKDHSGETGGEIPIKSSEAGAESESTTLELPAQSVSLPQLQRIRRAFITLNRQHTLPKNRIRHSFTEYLNANLAS